METGLEIALIGMAGRFPGAKNIHEFWNNLKNGIESVSFFSNEELIEVGVEPGTLEDPNYVKACACLEDIEYFDAPFFGYTPKEAEIMDPQVRIFHEVAWTALEDAGYDPIDYKGLIGLFAGAAPNLNWQARSLLSGKSGEIGTFDASLLIEKEYLSMRVAYKLNLSGPGIFIYTACSTSLVAIHMGSQALLNGECDIVLAGGVTVLHLGKGGYMYQEGMISSPDGHCRAFDAGARGFPGGNGAGAVVLKRLNDAVSDGDRIYAIIRGSAINNDGMQKPGFTAPSVKGQAEVIKMAMQMAEVEPESIGYVETHGTGTELGDPIEVQGLKIAFNTKKKGFCGIGSVKTNVGHTDCAAGTAGFIKTVLALKHRLIPSSLYFETPNPIIDFIDSPFYVNSKPTRWERGKYPLRAGVSAFGQGGTNAHVIIEEWPRDPSPGTALSGRQLILLSAKTQTALGKAAQNLADHFRKNPRIHLADAAYTLQVGRHGFKYRKMLECSTIDEAVDILDTPNPPRVHSFALQEENRPVVFLFPAENSEKGIQVQYKNLGEILYRQKAVFREEMDRCREISKSQPPAWFMFQYALAKMLMHFGIKPYACIGTGSGEITAKCLSGEISLESALESAVPTAISFSHRLKELAKLQSPVFIYFGPHTGKIEKVLAHHGKGTHGEGTGHMVGLLGPSPDENPDLNFLMTRVGRLWLYGINIDWEKFYSGEQRYRILLPTYPFEGQRYWIDETSLQLTVSKDASPAKTPKKPRSALYPRPELSSEYIPASGETEIKLVQIWQEFFGFEKIGTRDDFFELGGDSLKVIYLVANIRKKLDVVVPIPEFFDRPTIRELAPYVRDNPRGNNYLSIEPIEKKEYYPMALTQKRLYILQQIDQGNVSYNISDVYRLDIKVEAEKFENIFRKLIKRHLSFRTSFHIVEGEPVQKIHDHADLSMEYHDVEGETQEARSETIEKIIQEFMKPFDLSRAPLLRVGLIRMAENKHILMTDMSHLISDGMSVIITIRDFTSAYMGKELPALPIQYKDFSVWQVLEKESGDLKKQEEYWLKEFAGEIPVLDLPLDYPRPGIQSFEGELISFQLEKSETAKLKEIADSENATIFMILLAIFNVLLSKLNGQEEIVVGTGVAGRRCEELHDIVGMFINTVPLKNYPAKEKTFKEFLNEIRNKTLQAFENQDYPFEELVEKVVLKRDRSRNPLFDVFLMSLVMDDAMLGSPGGGYFSRPQKYNYDPGIAKFDISILYTEAAGKLIFEFEYCIRLFKRETLERLVVYFKDIVSSVIEDKNVKLKDIKISFALLTAEADVIRDEQSDFRF